MSDTEIPTPTPQTPPLTLTTPQKADITLRYCEECNAIEVRIGGFNLGDISLEKPKCSFKILSKKDELPEPAQQVLDFIKETYK